jgi:peptidoglycan/LPS O-acetylase OafA/YrhL
LDDPEVEEDVAHPTDDRAPTETDAEEQGGRATAGSGDPAGGGHVRALDGMRAIAVVLVLLFHLEVPIFSAGFVGVDIFFVLSGFLITTLLLTELERTGRISLPQFWARRARRLLPALVVLLLVVAFSTWLTGTFTERTSVRGDLLATTGYVANWHFIGTSSYFADIGLDSPLEHTWSLAIEEQFYLVWPIVALGAAAILSKRPRLAVGSVALALAAVSALLLWLLWSPEGVERAYMGTDARIFEPLLGAGGAALVATPGIRRHLERWATLVLGIGIAALISGIALIAAVPTSYYRGGAVLVSLGTLCTLAPLWIGHGGTVSKVLSWGPIAWIGVISYGAYLWHWPLAVWLGARDDDGSLQTVTRLAVVVLTFGIAAASYYAIEQPIRRGRTGGRHAGVIGRDRRVRLTLAAIPLSLLAVAGISLAATRVPPIAPSVPVMMVVGDSVPLHLSAAMETALAERGWRLVSAAAGACAPTGETMARPNGTPVAKAELCTSEIVSAQDRLVEEADPDVVLWWDRWSLSDFFTASGEHVSSGTPRFWELRRRGLRSATARLSSRGATVVFIAIEPPGEAVRSRCTPQDCPRWVRFQLDHYEDITKVWNAALRDFAEGRPGKVRYLSVTDAVCAEDVAPCDDRVGGAPARPDGTHYEGAGQELVMDVLFRRLGPLMDSVRGP